MKNSIPRHDLMSTREKGSWRVPALTGLLTAASFLVSPVDAQNTRRIPALEPLVPLQGTWRQVPELAGRTGHAMAYDPVRKRIVLFGGVAGNATSSSLKDFMLRDTWEWDGKRWTALRPRHRPSAGFAHEMAFDPVSRRVILYGGYDGTRVVGGTWVWDGRDWTQLRPATSPGPLYQHGMATDPVRGRIVLFGGAPDLVELFGMGKARAETWEWQGGNWVRRRPKTVPDARIGGRMTYDRQLGRIVMYGGMAAAMFWAPNYTWEWDGSDWSRHGGFPTNVRGDLSCDPLTGRPVMVTSVTQVLQQWERRNRVWVELKPALPAKRYSVELCLDEANKQLVLFATHRDTWTWNGTSWKQVFDSSWPFVRLGLVQDVARDQTLFLGIQDIKKELQLWRLDGERLERLKPAASPPRRDRFHVLYHGGLRKVWLWGGWNGKVTFNDVWLFDGSTWSKHPRAGGPSNQYGRAAYDSRRDRVVYVNSRETWEWSARLGWQQRSPSLSPPGPLADHALAYDAGRGRTVLWGGRYNKAIRSVWEWDGQSWSEVKTVAWPKARFGHHMFHLPRLGGVVMFGGTGGWGWGGERRDTWLWNGRSWREVAGPRYFAPTKGGIYFHRATYDANRQRIVASHSHGIGGRTVWEFLLPSLESDRRYPGPGERFTLRTELAGQAKRPFLLALSGARRPGIFVKPIPHVGTEVLPVKADPLFWLSLQLGLSTTLDASGSGAIPFMFPNDARLVGMRVHAAGLTFDSKGRPGAITNGIEMRIFR